MEVRFDVDLIEETRLKKLMTIDQVASRAKIGRATYYRMKRGGVVSIPTIRRILKVLKIDAEDCVEVNR